MPSRYSHAARVNRFGKEAEKKEGMRDGEAT
jgi:hypothetical protein